MNEKKFDCVEMMHKGTEYVREQTKGMSREQELEYWRQKTESLLARKKRLSKARKAS